MKTADLKAGEVYAVRRAGQPCMLLSTEVYSLKSSLRFPDSIAPAPAGVKPRRDPTSLAWGKKDYGFVLLAGGLEDLTAVNAEEALAEIVEHGRLGAPEDTSVEFVTHVTEILAPYTEYQAAEEERMAAMRKRLEEDDARRESAKQRYDAVAARLNAVLSSGQIKSAKQASLVEPTGMALTLSQAEEIADLLDGGAK